MNSIKLSDGIIQHFEITNYYSAPIGGQKTVFIVTIDSKLFALKVIKIADERFEREVSICNKFVSSVGIPTIQRIELYGTDTIILEEFIDGDDLTNKIADFKNNDKKVLDFISAIAEILKPVWEAKYVHRDLKPANIRIRKNNKPVVLDFGIARALDENSLTATGSQPYSWPFASPEQFNGKKNLISYRTDFFCLGIIAYHLYTNLLPFGNTKLEISESFNSGKLIINSGNQNIDSFCNTVFRVNPSERPRKIDNFINLLKI
tara:strand:+ start:2841 stop:3626 length:786 start_codon:yes stop_codon:yes gene_type:complete